MGERQNRFMWEKKERRKEEGEETVKKKNLLVRIQYITINKNRYNQKRVKIIKQHTGVHKGDIFTPANDI